MVAAREAVISYGSRSITRCSCDCISVADTNYVDRDDEGSKNIAITVELVVDKGVA